MTVYQAPRSNKHNIMMDRHIQKTVFDCNQKLFRGIQTHGFLNGKQVGTSPVETDWKTKLTPVPNDPFSQRTLAAVCNLPIAAAGSPGGISPGAGEQKKAKLSSGSGIILNHESNILTNAHVVNGCKSLAVKATRLDAQAAKVEAMDPKNDLAILKIAAGYGRAALFRPPAVPAKLGESAGVIGYPLAGLLSTEPQATFGQVSSVAGVNNDYTLFQISAPVQPGNSGSPVFDGAGNVIGVVVSEFSGLMTAKFGVLPQNVNFAIRGELAQIFMQAHGVKFSVSEAHNQLATEALAAAGQESTVLILCSRE
jgi:S1-C subfamily serine protease